MAALDSWQKTAFPKPAFAAFALLHKLGDERIAVDSDFSLATRRPDGTRILLYGITLRRLRLASPAAGSPRTVTLKFKGHSAEHALISRVDGEHGDPRPAYEKMGSPRYPTEAQIETLRSAARLPAPESRDLHNGELTLTLPAHGLAVIELK